MTRRSHPRQVSSLLLLCLIAAGCGSGAGSGSDGSSSSQSDGGARDQAPAGDDLATNDQAAASDDGAAPDLAATFDLTAADAGLVDASGSGGDAADATMPRDGFATDGLAGDLALGHADAGAPDGGPPYPSLGRSSWGRVGTVMVFDLNVTKSQATQAAPEVDWVWGSASGGALANPLPWFMGNPGIVASRYFVSTVDNRLAGHDLAWYQANHPDWILYDCDGSNTPTMTVAYQPGLPNDVPIDIENPAAVRALVHSAADYALANHFNAIAADQVLFFNYQGGQGPNGDYWGCGVWQGKTFVRRYAPTYKGTVGAKTFPNYDPRWNVDMANWVTMAENVLATDYAGKGLHMVVNHPAGNLADPLEQQVLRDADAVLDETGFADYGNWAKAPSLFQTTLDAMEYAQAHGTAYMIVNKNSSGTTPTPAQLEWSIATYLIGNEGNAYLYTSGNQYGYVELFPEYTTVDNMLGVPCGAWYGGKGYDANNPHLFYRRFHGGLVVVNAGSLPAASEQATLPSHSYSDLEGRAVTNPLAVASSDAYVLFTSANGCQ